MVSQQKQQELLKRYNDEKNQEKKDAIFDRLFDLDNFDDNDNEIPPSSPPPPSTKRISRSTESKQKDKTPSFILRLRAALDGRLL